MKKIILSALLSSTLIYAEGVFSLGHKNYGVNFSPSANHVILGGNINYFVVDNLSVGASFNSWLGSKPSMNKFTIPITYYFPLEYSVNVMEYMVRPYVGVLGSYTFIGDTGKKYSHYSNYSSFGGRIGGAAELSDILYVYAGWLQIKDNYDFANINSGHPEFGFGMSF